MLPNVYFYKILNMRHQTLEILNVYSCTSLFNLKNHICGIFSFTYFFKWHLGILLHLYLPNTSCIIAEPHFYYGINICIYYMCILTDLDIFINLNYVKCYRMH